MLKKSWRLSEFAFLRLLSWLDDGANSNGETYLNIRQKLVDYFDRKNCRAADDLADETLNRVARRLEEEGAIVSTAPARYCYTVAKFVFLERFHEEQQYQVSLDALSEPRRSLALTSAGDSESERRQAEEKRLTCLQRCLDKLDRAHRDLILGYYQGDQRAKIENRQRLAARFGMTANALSIRACRIRGKLETCARQCMKLVETEDPARTP